MPYKITQISQAKRNTNNVNIFLDDEYWVNINKDTIIKYDLHKGKELEEHKKKEIEKESQEGKILEKVYRYISVRPRSTFEVKTYLTRRRGLESDVAERIIQKLQKQNLLSDEEFTRWYVENRLSTGVHGRNKIKAELYKKRVNSKIINKILNELLSTEEQRQKTKEKIRKYAEKTVKTIKEKDKYKRKQKLISRLLYRGFSYEDVKEVVGEVINK